MALGANSDLNDSSKPAVKRNWWKLGFFVCLVLFELVREFAVVAGATGARPSVMALLYSSDGYVRAQGSWKRIDGGDQLIPTVVTIECDRQTGVCLEVSANINDNYVSAPEIDRFNATFADNSVTYENDNPDCARYAVRMDLVMKKVFSVRERKENRKNPNCKLLESRIEMQLSDGLDLQRDPLKGHFVPMLQLLSYIAK